MDAQRQVELGGAGRELRDPLHLVVRRLGHLHTEVQLLQVLGRRRRLRRSPPAPGLPCDQGRPRTVLRGPGALQRQLPRTAQGGGELLSLGGQVDDCDSRVRDGHLGPLGRAVVDEDQRLHREAELLGDLTDGDGLRAPARSHHREVLQAERHVRVSGEHRFHVGRVVARAQAQHPPCLQLRAQRLLHQPVGAARFHVLGSYFAAHSAPQCVVTVHDHGLDHRPMHGGHPSQHPLCPRQHHTRPLGSDVGWREGWRLDPGQGAGCDGLTGDPRLGGHRAGTSGHVQRQG